MARSRLATSGPSGWAAGLVTPTGFLDSLVDAALILLVGGMGMLALLLVISFLQRIRPEPVAFEALEAPAWRQLRPVAGAAADPALGLADLGAPTLPLDAVMAHVVDLQLGEPRVLRAVGRHVRVRLYGCRGCAQATEGKPGCAFECAGLEEAFRRKFRRPAIVREAACRPKGAPYCEFEVHH